MNEAGCGVGCKRVQLYWGSKLHSTGCDLWSKSIQVHVLADVQRNPERFLPRTQRGTTPEATSCKVGSAVSNYTPLRSTNISLLSYIRMPVPVSEFVIKLITNKMWSRRLLRRSSINLSVLLLYSKEIKDIKLDNWKIHLTFLSHVTPYVESLVEWARLLRV